MDMMSEVNSSDDMEHFTVPGIVFGPVEQADVRVKKWGQSKLEAHSVPSL